MALNNISPAIAARPDDAFLSSYSAALHNGAAMTISAKRLDPASVTEIIALHEALKPIEAVIDAFTCQSKFADKGATLNAPGAIICQVSDFVLEHRQAIACRVEHARPTGQSEAGKRVYFILEYAAWCGENLPRTAALGAALAVEEAAQGGMR